MLNEEYNTIAKKNGMWLSLVERCVRDAKAAGSNPVIPTSMNEKPFEISTFQRVF